ELNRDSLNLNTHSLCAIIDEALDRLRLDEEEHKLKLEFKLAHAPKLDKNDRCQFDQECIRLLVFYLLDNAVKYSYPERKLTVELFFDWNHWKLSITNFGDYIWQEDLKAIFAPGVRRPSRQGAAAPEGMRLGSATDQKI